MRNESPLECMFGSLTYLIVKLSEDNFNIQTQFIFENNNKAINLYVGNQLLRLCGHSKITSLSKGGG